MLKLARRNHDAGSIREHRAGSISDADLALIRDLLHRETGIVLNESKRALVEARLARRLRALDLPDYAGYIAMVRDNPQGGELVHLIDAISTNVTRFFREDEHFSLVDEVVGSWIAAGRRKLRFWSAACSSGEEPYSLALTLAHHLEGRSDLDVKILATDINTQVLEEAARGFYPEERLETVPADLKRKYFRRVAPGDGRTWAVSDDLKRLLMLRRLNFTRFPYPIKGVFDVIFCRNAMIYFDRDLRARMVGEFARLLRPDGYLLIGHAETLIGVEQDFVTVRPSVYRRIPNGGKS